MEAAAYTEMAICPVCRAGTGKLWLGLTIEYPARSIAANQIRSPYSGKLVLPLVEEWQHEFTRVRNLLTLSAQIYSKIEFYKKFGLHHLIDELLH